MAVPYTFGSATSSIPLSQLDSNFATTITLGNTAIQLGNTVTTLNNMTLANVTVQSGNVTIGQANAVVYTNGSNVATANASVLACDGVNMGVGVTPSAWQSTRRALQVGDTSAIAYGGNQTTVGNNFFVNSSGTNSYIKASAYAQIYIQGSDGSHEIYTAPNTGTAGGSASFTRLLAVNTGKSLALEGASSQTGTGITFPTTQNASTNVKTLDDYEEGTWTPNLLFGGGATGITYQSNGRQGTYVKVGKMVTVSIYIYTSSTGSDTGNMTVTGLPFSAMPSSTYYMDYYYPFGARAGYILPSGAIPMVYLAPGGSQFEFYYTVQTSSSTPTRLTKSLVTNTSVEISVQFSYLASA